MTPSLYFPKLHVESSFDFLINISNNKNGRISKSTKPALQPQSTMESAKKGVSGEEN
jgi:hypothetical protein